MIVERNALTMVHERYNTDWILQNGIGVVIRSFTEVDKAIASILDPERLPAFQRCVAAMRNRAVFEIPDLLDSIMTATVNSRGEAVRLGA